MGKSSYVLHLAAKLARKYLSYIEDNARYLGGEGDNLRVPILIKLAGTSPRNEKIQGLLGRFLAIYPLRCASDALNLLAKKGKLLFLVDGFDEMDLVGDASMRAAHWNELCKLATKNNKIIFIGRPGYFATKEEKERLLHLQKQPLTELFSQLTTIEINLKPFENNQILNYFKGYFSGFNAEELFKYIEGQPQLLGLARRPALMYIICETLHKKLLESQDSTQLELDRKLQELSNSVRPVQLLEQYTDNWIKRDESKTRQLLVDAETRREFSRNLAQWMFLNNVVEVNSQQIASLYETWFSNDQRLGSLALKEGIESDLRTCSFLVPTANDGFTFAHKPFYEYFMATSIFSLVLSKENRHYNRIFQALWPKEISRHIADLLLVNSDTVKYVAPARFPNSIRGFEDSMAPKFKAIMGDFRNGLNQKRDLSESVKNLSVTLKYSVQLNIEFLKAISETVLGRDISPYSESFKVARKEYHLYASSNKDRNLAQIEIYTGLPFMYILRSFNNIWAYDARKNKFSDRISKRLSSNLDVMVMVFSMYRKLDLSESDFRFCYLPGWDFSGTDLDKAIFYGADLRRAIFTDCNLKEADFRMAKLKLANFKNANLSNALLPDGFVREDLSRD